MTAVVKEETNLFDRFSRCAALFVTLSIALLVAFFAVRGMEFLSVTAGRNAPPDFATVVRLAVIVDLASFLRLLPVLFLPFLAACAVTRSTTWRCRVFAAEASVVIVCYAALVKYFSEARVPLGADLFAYSVADIKTVVATADAVDAFAVSLLVIPLGILWGSLAWLRARGLVRPAYAVAVLGLGAALHGTTAGPPATALTSEYSSSLASNKLTVFAQESLRYAMPGPDEPDSRPGGERRATSSEFTYIDPEYPFLRTETAPDVLGEFFTFSRTEPPNLVFLLVEGLGKAFSGPNAYLGSFTPFLDHLAIRSLYWENFLASQGRTFAVLSSVFGSLPFADQGFTALGPEMPKHLSLLSILKHNGYRIKFYSGSDAALDLDNQRLFLAHQHTDILITEPDFDARYSKEPDTGWGYPDRELMRKALETERRETREPYVSIVQTMSMHSPFAVPDQERYASRFEERMTTLGFNDAEKARHRADANIYATILYADDALRFFFDEYRKLPAYDNTIFILTGDHRLPEIPMSTKIDRFHVPLIIFSPMLKRAAHFESISSHLDITPSLLAFLRARFGLRTPSAVSWVGSGLDVNPAFRNIHAYPLKHTKYNLIDFISGMYFIDQDALFAVSKHMDLEPIQDDAVKSRLIAEFDEYKSRNNRFIRDLKLIPDGLYEQFLPARP